MTAHDSHDVGGGTLSEQAAYWLIILNDANCSATDREAFAKWVSRSPERVEAYLWASMVSSALKSPAVQWQDTPAEELIKEARASAQVIPLHQQLALPATRPGPLLRSAWMMVSITFAALLAVMIAVWLMPGSRSYRTAVGEQRSVVLDDGSIITINTASEVKVDYGRERRLIQLVAGEALFEVAHDAQRPFDVVIDDIIVRAVGTKFNIDRRDRRTTVSVMEGTVKVISETSSNKAGAAAQNQAAARIVTAAQRIVLSETMLGAPEQIPDLAPLTAWTQRQLVFENQPLAQVAEEFNRYNRHQILIRSSSLSERAITGVFQANDSYPFLVFIQQIPGVRVEVNDRGDSIVTLQDEDTSG